MGAALIWGLLAGAALAAPGECTVTGFEPFACDVVLDGNGLTFELPDGQYLAFAAGEADSGTVYLTPANAAPGRAPVDMGRFVSGDAPGCWVGTRKEFEFCALVQQ